jgi:thiamine-phosphate pyrophosphorylase
VVYAQNKRMLNLILISHPRFFEGENRIISSLMKRFHLTLHLRKPDATDEEYRLFLQSIPSHLHPEIMIHGAYALNEEFDLKGVHFSTANRMLADDYRTGIKSTSCHSVEELKETDSAFDHQFLSPVFPSISKKGYKGNLDMQEVKEYLKQPRHSRVIALGGVDKEKIACLKDVGFDGVALLGAVWGDNPEDEDAVVERFREIFLMINDQ